MNGNPDGSGLIRNGAGDGLTNPPGGIGGKLVTLAVIKLFHRLDQAQISLLNQIQEQHPTAHISLCNADHQTQIGLGKALFRLLVPKLHPLCQLNLFLGGKKRNLTDLLQVHAHRILDADAVRHGKVDVLHIHLVLLGENNLLIIHIIVLGNAKHIHIVLLQRLQDLLELLLLQRHVRKKFTDLLIFQYIFFLPGSR